MLPARTAHPESTLDNSILVISFSMTDGHKEEKNTSYPIITNIATFCQGIFVSNKTWENFRHICSRGNFKEVSECGKVHASDAVMQVLQSELP
jgi:hypothetical protein